MTEITPKTIKQLRDMTGAGMMDCKKAITEAEGNEERAIEILRERGLVRAEYESSTLRGNLGLPVPENRYTAARQAGSVAPAAAVREDVPAIAR